MSLVSCLHAAKMCSIRLGSLQHEERETWGKVELQIQKHVSGFIDSFCLKTLHYCPCKLSRYHKDNGSAHKLYYVNSPCIQIRKVFFFLIFSLYVQCPLQKLSQHVDTGAFKVGICAFFLAEVNLFCKGMAEKKYLRCSSSKREVRCRERKSGSLTYRCTGNLGLEWVLKARGEI